MRAYWDKEFAEGDPHYGFLKNTVPTAEERKDIADFFFWTAWAAGTNRPGLNYSYTNNWPSDRTVGNTASTEALLWSLASIIALLRRPGHRRLRRPPLRLLLRRSRRRCEAAYRAAGGAGHAQPAGQRQVLPGRRAAVRRADLQRRPAGPLHGPPRHVLREVHRRDVSRTAGPRAGTCSWRSSGSPSRGWARRSTWRRSSAGSEPQGQRLLVNILFVAAVAVTVGSLLGEVLGIKGYLGDRPGSGSATRAGSISSWADSGRSCSSAA